MNWKPNFYRCRTVEIIERKYVSCSCGMPVRFCSFPCRHIYALFKDVDIRMFGLRWLLQYQHCFQREGKKDFTDLFREMEEVEFNRDIKFKGEDFYVGNMLKDVRFHRPVDQVYPIALDGTTGEYYHEIETHKKINILLEISNNLYSQMNK